MLVDSRVVGVASLVLRYPLDVVKSKILAQSKPRRYCGGEIIECLKNCESIALQPEGRHFLLIFLLLRRLRRPSLQKKMKRVPGVHLKFFLLRSTPSPRDAALLAPLRRSLSRSSRDIPVADDLCRRRQQRSLLPQHRPQSLLTADRTPGIGFLIPRHSMVMKVIAAYLLAILGGNANPSAHDLKHILGSALVFVWFGVLFLRREEEGFWNRRGEAAVGIPPFSSISHGATGANGANAVDGHLVTRRAAAFSPNGVLQMLRHGLSLLFAETAAAQALNRRCSHFLHLEVLLPVLHSQSLHQTSHKFTSVEHSQSLSATVDPLYPCFGLEDVKEQFLPQESFKAPPVSLLACDPAYQFIQAPLSCLHILPGTNFIILTPTRPPVPSINRPETQFQPLEFLQVHPPASLHHHSIWPPSRDVTWNFSKSTQLLEGAVSLKQSLDGSRSRGGDCRDLKLLESLAQGEKQREFLGGESA
ncbi:60S acidic ribosomal protein P2-4 [Platanthera zijinensis]|uniref:60S acidic ribosomal protein P2-4 n=1 Tax=Platanthera zijinensis TaxID=2320716 RepID=A0AAP0B839_9ASPA